MQTSHGVLGNMVCNIGNVPTIFQKRRQIFEITYVVLYTKHVRQRQSFFFFSLQATVSFLNIWNVWSSLVLWWFQGAPKENIALKLVNIMMEMRLSNQILTCLCRTLLLLRLRNEHNLNQGTQETKDKNLWSVWLDCNRQFLHTHHRVVWSFLTEVLCKNQSL